MRADDPLFGNLDEALLALGADTVGGEWAFPADVDPTEAFEIGDVPLLLLPVRLETRFAGDELMIRIYPDQIHLDGHMPRLTVRERRLGMAYWNRRLDGDPDGARTALVAELPPRRAVWVARELRPTVAKDGSRDFPDTPTRSGTKPAVARLLPDRWCVLGFVGSERAFVAFGSDVTTPLPCAADVAELVPFDVSGEALPVDAGMAWMVDYEQAVAAGMAITVGVAGFDVDVAGLTLIVVGLRDELHNETAINDLLQAHAYTDGLRVAAQGAPTNNTDMARAADPAAVDDVAALFARELDDVGLADPEASAAGQLARALGFEDPSLLLRLPGADRDEDAEMAAMNRVLWPVTWGEYLDHLLGPDGGPSIVPGSGRIAIRDLFIDHVRGGAPLPTIIAGAQPYGLLPVMRRSGGSFASPDPLVALEAILLDLRESWRASLAAVARLDPVVGTSDEEAVVEVLASLAHPARFVVRRLTWQFAFRIFLWELMWKGPALTDPATGLNGLTFLWSLIVPSLDSVAEQLDALQDLWDDPSVAAVEPEHTRDARNMLDASIEMCTTHQRRQEPLDGWYPDAYRGVFDASAEQDPMIIWSDYGTATADRLFAWPLVSGGATTAAAYLANLRRRVPVPVVGQAETTPGGPGGGVPDSGTPPFDGILDPTFHDHEPLLFQLLDGVVGDVAPMQGVAYRAALDLLAACSEETLELRLRETLGLASYRLDAWLTALATDDLEQRRAAGRGGLRVGGFGWVEELRRDAAGTRSSKGFIHAPSLAHASTAAVLRAGYDAHASSDPESLLGVDLSSERVRTAAYLLDGVRQGGALGDLLGCRFERTLHDAARDRYIDQCRRRVLEAQGITRAPRGPVDGLELAAIYGDGGVEIREDAGTFTVQPGAAQPTPERVDLQAALEDLLGSMDAISDVAIADSVHHLLQGASSRASATLESISTGAVPPPELAMLDTPRPGASVSHRVLVTVGGAKPEAGWAPSPRAILEPGLSFFVAGLLGLPERVRCAVRVARTGEVIGVTLADLAKGQGASALDLVFESRTVWADRARAIVLARPEHAGDEEGLEIDLAPDGIGEGETTFADAADVADALRSLLGRSRPLDGRDLALPGSDIPPGTDLADGEKRLARFEQGLAGAVANVEALLPRPTEEVPRPVGHARLDTLRQGLAVLSAYGLPGAIPVHGYAEAGRAAAYADAWVAAGVGRARLDAAAALRLPADAPAEADETRARRLARRAEALLGAGFPFELPVVTDASGFGAAMGDSDALLHDDPPRAMGWLRSVARVRPDLAKFVEAIEVAELVRDTTLVLPLVGQLPIIAGDSWIGLEAPADRRQGRQSFVVVDAGGLGAIAAGAPVTGLVVDTWTEVIPAEQVVTGVAVNFDQPTSRAPQTMLLAQPPANQTWSFDNVVDTLLETFEAAKLRAVDPDVVLGYGHHGPAIFPRGHVDAGPQEDDTGG